jgi:hypothetical protein
MQRILTVNPRRGLPLLAALVLLLIAASSNRMVQLTIVNKSAYPVGIQLTGDHADDYDNEYYLSVSKGTIKTFQVMADTYSVSTTYIEPYDPVYGYDCGTTSSQWTLDHKVTATIKKCGGSAVVGEPTRRSRR